MRVKEDIKLLRLENDGHIDSRLNEAGIVVARDYLKCRVRVNSRERNRKSGASFCVPFEFEGGDLSICIFDVINLALT